MPTIPQVSQAMQTVLTSVADTAARATSFVQRQSKLTGALFVQSLVFGFLANPQASREELAQTAAALGLHITAQGLDQRLSECGALCLLEVLDAATARLLAADPLAIELLARFNGVYIQDSTLISLPSNLAQTWRASGNQHTPAAESAGLKLSVRLDLSTGALLGPHTDHAITSEHSLQIQHWPLPPGGLRIADLGFFNLEVLHEIAQQQAYFLTRPQITTVMRTSEGQRLDLLKRLSTHNAATFEMPILLGAQQRVECRLLAQRVPQEVADQRRRRIREEAKRRGRTPNAAQLALAEWSVFVTNVPEEMLSVQEAVVLGRARWQIELLFKLWKSQGQIDKWRSAKGAAILCELYAKLIGMIVQHWIMMVGCWAYADRSLMKAASTLRKHAMCLATGLGCEERLSEAIRQISECLAVGCRINKSLKTPRTYQLLLDVNLAALA